MTLTNWIFKFSLIGFVVVSLSLGAQTLSEELKTIASIVVDKNGNGDYTTVQEGINAVPDYNSVPTIIFVKKGVYREKVVLNYKKTNVIIVGEDVDSTKITWADYGNKMLVNGDPAVGGHTFSTYTFRADAHGFQAYNINFDNPTTEGQGVAYHSNGDKQILYHCKITGGQDTYFDNYRTRRYIKDCFISGGTDFIFGFGVTLFDSCQIHSVSKGYLTASSTPQYYKFGHVFKYCRLTPAPGVNGISLGRPWFDYANTVFYECWLTDAISSAGWTAWGGREATCYYREYNNSGSGSNYANRVSFGKQLSTEEALAYTIENIFGADNFPSTMGSEVDAKEFSLMRDRHEAAGYVARADTILYAGRDTFPAYPTDNWLPVINEKIKTIIDKYTFRFTDPINSIYSIEKILINNNELEGFDPEKTNYFIELHDTTTFVPQISFEGSAKLTITNPVEFPGVAKLSFVSGDYTKGKDYSIYLSIDSAYWETEVKMFVVNRKDTIYPVSGNFEYNVMLAEGDKRLTSLDVKTKVYGQKFKIVAPKNIPGVCSVVITAPNGTSTVTYTFNVDFYTGINDINYKNDDNFSISLVSNELFLLSKNSVLKNSEITIYDLNGKTYKTAILSELKKGSNQTGIFMEQLPKGCFFIQN